MDETLDLGDFTVFGFTRDPNFVENKFINTFGVNPRIVPIGSLGQFFFYSSSGEIGEAADSVVIKLGFLRDTSKNSLNAMKLLEQKIVNPEAISTNAFSGNGLVVGLSKIKPSFSVFQTLISLPQLYYSVSSDGIICSDVLRCVARAMPKCELNEDILPQHFLFRSVHGSSTYYRGIDRLIPGQLLRWADGNISINSARSVVNVSEESAYIKNDARALNILSESIQDVIADYVSQIRSVGHHSATLLSGGVDSSLIQYFINNISDQRPWKSISFSIQVPSFGFETEYARQASQILHTEHSFVHFAPEDYPGLLTRVTKVLSQPPRLESEPSLLAVAEYVHAENWPERYFFTANAADSLFGASDSAKLKGLHYINKIPFSIPLMRGTGRILKNISSRRSHMFMKGAEILSSQKDPDSYNSPLNTVLVYVLDENWDIIERCFGDQALREAFAYRRNLAASYSNSEHYLDKVHAIDLFVGSLEQDAQRRQLFLAHKLDQVDPFCDEDLLKVAFTFHPDMRFIKGFKYKHLLKRLLAEKTGAPVAHKPKGPSTVNDDLVAWMRSGSLRPLIENIERPPFMEKKDFDRMINKPDYFMWPLLTFDIFKKCILSEP